MKSRYKTTAFQAAPEKVFAQMDDFSKTANGTIVTISIAYEPPEGWFYGFLSFHFGGLYCNWCLNNMLNDTKKALESKER